MNFVVPFSFSYFLLPFDFTSTDLRQHQFRLSPELSGKLVTSWSLIVVWVPRNSALMFLASRLVLTLVNDLVAFQVSTSNVGFGVRKTARNYAAKR